MTRADFFSIVAILVSICCMGISIYPILVDRARVRVKIMFNYDLDHGSAWIAITAVNAGRRPIILRGWGGLMNNGGTYSSFFEGNPEGIRLGENTRYDFHLERNDILVGSYQESLQTLWVEDSLGRRYQPKQSEGALQSLADSSPAFIG